MTAVQYQRLKKFMSDSNYTHTDEWLSACVSWVKDSYPANQITDAFLKDQIYEQWLGTDLAEMESSCLPSNLSQTGCIKLNGRFGLQINLLNDIGESSYTQLNKLKKTESENTSVEATDSTSYKPTWEPKPRRCLYLSLTDGSQNVFGLEMSSIPSLTLAIKPGAKIVIIGPVECRRGVLQLKTTNVKLLGGEVEQLAITNSVENVLARNLNQPENTSASIPITESQLDRLGGNNTNTRMTQESRINDGEFPEDDGFDLAAADAFGDDDLFMDIDETALIASSNVHDRTTQMISQQSALTEPVNSFYHPNSVRSNTAESHDGFPSIDEIVDLEAETLNYTTRTSTSRRDVEFVPVTNEYKPNRTPTVKPQGPPQKSSNTKPTSSSKSHGFKNVKTEVSRQIKIEKYLKPMPVIIDPPTPERETRKRLKKAMKENVSVPSDDSSTAPTVATVEPVVNSTTNEDFQFDEDNSNDSLMDLVESSINEQLKTQENIITDIVPETSNVCDTVMSPIIVSKHPYLFLKQIHEEWDKFCSAKKLLYVKGCVATLVSNIRMENGQWALDVCINDGSGFLNCTISSLLLNGIIGFTPAEMKQLKKASDGKAKISKSMKNLTDTLIHWNGIFGIEIGRNPLVASYSEIMIHHIAAVKERLTHL